MDNFTTSLGLLYVCCFLILLTLRRTNVHIEHLYGAHYAYEVA